MQEKKQRPVCERTAGEQRTGMDRRVLSYDWHIPERRAVAERRLAEKCAISALVDRSDRRGAEW